MASKDSQQHDISEQSVSMQERTHTWAMHASGHQLGSLEQEVWVPRGWQLE